MVPEPHRAVVYIHGAYQRVLRALVRVVLHYKKQVPREALVRLRRVAAHRKAGGLVIQPRRVGVGRVVDIHAVRKYHSRLGTQRGEAVAQLLEKSVGVRRGNEPSALRKEALRISSEYSSDFCAMFQSGWERISAVQSLR